MFRAIGFVIILWSLHSFFGNVFTAFESAVIASLQTVEVAAIISQEQMQQINLPQ